MTSRPANHHEDPTSECSAVNAPTTTPIPASGKGGKPKAPPRTGDTLKGVVGSRSHKPASAAGQQRAQAARNSNNEPSASPKKTYQPMPSSTHAGVARNNIKALAAPRAVGSVAPRKSQPPRK